MLEAIERIRRLTDKPLAAQPNAGIPRSIEGPQHLSVLAGIYGQLRAQVCDCRSEPGGRMLRNNAGAHQGDEVRAAHG